MPLSTERFCASRIIDSLCVARTGPTCLLFQRIRLLARRNWSVEGFASAVFYPLLVSLLSPQSASAEPLPANKLVTSNLVSPSAAWSRFGTSTTHTAGLAATTTTSPDIIALARGLGSVRSEVSANQYAKNVLDYIRNNIDTEFRFGLGKGGRGALIDQSGTPFDKAELMVVLLQQKSVVATYNVGTITLNAQQFGLWTGFVTNLTESSQSFTVNARAACQLLADGGIPAIVNGASDCASLSGNLSSVVLGHIWVEAGGFWYDPSFKQHVLKAGIDIAAAAGCGNFTSSTCGTQVTSAAMSGTTSGTLGGSPWIQNVNKAALGSQLNSYALNIENYLKEHVPLGDIVDVVGGRRRDSSYSPALTSGSLSYPATVQYSWTGPMPDQFRTTMRVQFLDMDRTFFMDELAGRHVKYMAVPGQDKGSLLLDGQIIVSTSCVASSPNCGLFLTTSSAYPYDNPYTYNSAYIKITFGHPYASPNSEVNQPKYQFVRQAIWTPALRSAVSILVSLGKSTQSTEEYYSVVAGSPSLAALPSTADEDLSMNVNASVFASIRADQDRAAEIISSIDRSGFTRHHSLEIFEEMISYGTFGMKSLTSAMSVQSANNDSQRRSAAFETASALDALLEARDPDYFAYAGPSGGFAYDNAQGIKFINISPSGFSAVSGSLVDYSDYDKSLLQSGSSEGFSLIIPQDGRASCTSLAANPASPTASTSACPRSDVAPVIAYNGNASSHLIGARWKANGEPTPAVSDTNRRDFSSKDKKFFGLDLAKGALTLAPPPDIQAGSGTFPMSLPFQRTYSSATSWYERARFTYYASGWATYYNGPEWAGWGVPETIGAGWSHNYLSYANFDSSPSIMLGEMSGIDASTVLSAVVSLRGIHLANNFQSRLASIFTADWLLSKIAYSSISVKTPRGIESFARLPSGAFNGRPNSRSSLAVSGTYGGPYASLSSGPVYGYIGLNITYRDADGMAYLFPGSQIGPSTAAWISSIMDPAGVKVAFSKNGSTNPSMTITNSLGRSLLLQTAAVGYDARLASVSDDAGRVVSFQTENCPTISWYGIEYTAKFTCNTFKVVLPDSSVVKYEYNAGADSPDPTALIRSNYRLRRIYTADDPITPFRIVRYDDLFRVAEIIDPLGHSTKLFPSSIAREDVRMTARLDGVGVESSARFDSSGAPVRTTDPLGRSSTKTYDNAGRLLRTVMPEGNAVEYQYDVRGNRTRECAIAKGRVNWSSLTMLNEQAPQCDAGAGDLVTTTTYMEGPTVRSDQCSNYKTCNKPSYEIDARGNRTDYTWSGTHGQLLTETKPADANGVRPMTTYGYTAFTGVDGATFYLLTSKQEKIEATATTTTTWSYNGAAAKFTLKEQVVDSGGLSLRTCFKFDAAGNLIGKTEPKAGLASCP